jgi:hypothetical protein
MFCFSRTSSGMFSAVVIAERAKELRSFAFSLAARQNPANEVRLASYWLILAGRFAIQVLM